MKKILKIFTLAAALVVLGAQVALASVAILCYHEVDRPGDKFAVTSSALKSQLAYLQKNGYHFVSLDEYIRYTRGELTLPEKSVMITFDDGYQSFYTRAYPILKQYNAPAMLAVVTSWTDGEGKPTDVRSLATWDELRELEASGLVTVVSHSHALHKQQAIDPQGDRNGVAGYHLYINQRYETDDEYQARLAADMAETQRLFAEHLGHKSRAIVWPYGIYSAQSIDAALASGAEATFLLDGGLESQPGDSARIYAKRMIMASDVDMKHFVSLLTKNHEEWNSAGIRLAQVDMDNIYDKDLTQFNRNLATLATQLDDNDINLVALQAFADPDGDGNVDKVYFENSVVPVEADVFTHVANSLMQRNINVVAWLPTLNYTALATADGSNLVQSTGEKGWYNRISPFDDTAMARVATLYRELGAHTPVFGVLFQDDLYLNDGEDVSAPAQAAYKKAFGTELTALDRKNEAQMARFAALKTKKLTDVSMQMAAAFKETRPNAVIMRDIYTAPVQDKKSTAWFAQDYQDFLASYDYTVVMAYPYMDNAESPTSYLQGIASAVKSAGGAERSIVKIQSYDWKNERWIGAENFKQQLQTLERAGLKNLGYYPNTFYRWERPKAK